MRYNSVPKETLAALAGACMSRIAWRARCALAEQVRTVRPFNKLASRVRQRRAPISSISAHLKRSFAVADIELRFHKDMLVLSAPVVFALERQGINMQEDGELVMLMEPETVQDALRMEAMTGAQCLVASTEGICEARLAHNRMEDRAQEIALRALEGAWACKPQHLICEIGSCGLPLDSSSEASRAQTEQQYENAVQALNDASAELDLGMYDAILLNGLRSVADAECAIDAVRRKTDRPVCSLPLTLTKAAFTRARTSKILYPPLIGPTW